MQTSIDKDKDSYVFFINKKSHYKVTNLTTCEKETFFVQSKD